MISGRRLTALLALSVLAGLGLAASGDATPGDKDKGPKTVTVTDKDKDGKVTLGKGEVLEVRLAANLTTGFSWQLAKNDTDRLKPQGKPVYERPKEPRPGAGGMQVFRFTAEATGKSELRLIYKRPFEKDTPPAKTFKLTVEVE
jgi:inhibitor of cysteine peptidase